VLEALLQASPAAALSAERLLEQAWDENVDPFTNTVRVSIARLRRRLGQPKIIHNTPGVGYPDHRTALTAQPVVGCKQPSVPGLLLPQTWFHQR
jgi:DNA-binding winged helix-turn-helix (wHTH) protein